MKILIKQGILGYGADEFTLKPMNPKNLADIVLNLLSRDTVVKNK